MFWKRRFLLFPVRQFLIKKKHKIIKSDFVFLSFRHSKSQKQIRKCDSAYQETYFSEKIPENNAKKQKWSL